MKSSNREDTIDSILKALGRIAEDLKERPLSPKWWEEHFKMQDEMAAKLKAEHDSIRMSRKKFHKPFDL